MSSVRLKPSDSLRRAAQLIEDRAAERDLPHERSMARAVSAFSSLTGHALSETEGWLFMVVLKLSRATAGKLVADDWIDGAAYCALALEAAHNRQQADDWLEDYTLVKDSADLRRAAEDFKAELEACNHEYLTSLGSLP